MTMTTLDEALERLSKALEERDDARARLHVILSIVNGYLQRGEGTGTRSICLRIVQTLEAK